MSGIGIYAGTMVAILTLFIKVIDLINKFKIKKNMKNLLIFLIPVLFLCSCKIRHVATSKTETTSTEALTNIVKKDSVKIDTGKTHTEIKMAKNVQDSTEVEITPDSGAVQFIHVADNGNFTYTGKAKHIGFKKKSDDHSNIDEAIQENKSEITKTSLSDSANKKQTVHQVIKDKVTDSKPPIWLLIIPVLIIGALVYIVFLARNEFKQVADIAETAENILPKFDGLPPPESKDA